MVPISYRGRHRRRPLRLFFRFLALLLLVLMLALVPVYAALIGNYFLMSLFTRIVILAMAAVSLNLIMGFGGMVSFGHAAYLGIGGYAIGILAKEGINSGFLQWPLALAMSALFALAVGALSLRTRGVYFIMITLAFAQMIYYVVVALSRYGADDGLTISRRSQFAGLIDLSFRPGARTRGWSGRRRVRTQVETNSTTPRPWP